jgi:hypothetical protein
MTYPQLYACAAVLMLSMVMAFGLFAWALDRIGPRPALVPVHYASEVTP